MDDPWVYNDRLKLSRLSVPGGWLVLAWYKAYRADHDFDSQHTVTFMPDQAHAWDWLPLRNATYKHVPLLASQNCAKCGFMREFERE